MTKANRMKAAMQMLNRPGAKSDPAVMSHIYVIEYLEDRKNAPKVREETTYERLKKVIGEKKK